MVGEFGLERVVERVARLLVPMQIIRRQRLRVGDGGIQVELPVGVHREVPALAHDLEHRLDSPSVVIERLTAYLHLDGGVAALQIAPHLVLQGLQILARIVVAPGGVDGYLLVALPAPVDIRQVAVERFFLDFGHHVPDRHVDDAHGDGAVAVPAGLFVLHHAVPDSGRVEVRARLVQERFGLRLPEPGDEALAQKPLLGVASVRVEAEADDAFSVAHHVRDEGGDAHRHQGKIDEGVSQVRLNGNHRLADVDDLQGFLLFRMDIALLMDAAILQPTWGKGEAEPVAAMSLEAGGEGSQTRVLKKCVTKPQQSSGMIGHYSVHGAQCHAILFAGCDFTLWVGRR